MRTLYLHHHFTFAGLFRLPKPSLHSTSTNVQLCISTVRKRGCRLKHRSLRVRAFDEDSFSMSPFDELGDNEYAAGYMISSSDGEEDSDADYILNPVSDVDLPSGSTSSNDALTITAHRLAMIAKGRRKHRIRLGTLNNLVLIVFLIVLLLFVDWCAWKIVRLPLDSFYLSRPFFISIALVSAAGYICVPFLTALKIHQIKRRQRPIKHSKKRSTPTIGGIFFVPVGVGVAKFIAGSSSVEVSGAIAVTVAFAAIGLLHDILCFSKKNNSGLPEWIKLLLEIAVGTLFAFWLGAARITTPYSIKMLVPLPRPLGLVCIGKYYLLLTVLCFVAMGSGIDLADGPDGLAGGTAALAFVGMSIAVLPICSELAVFGASMAGACVGFLLHNRYKASVFMGDTGSLALGGALAAMAACTGMFFPLLISSGIFFLEASSIVMQIVLYTATKHLTGAGHLMFRMTPVHHHLELCGLREPIIVAGAYVASCLLALVAGYVGLISA
ncbi:phospho-N-acetylmuramoyl-pentapeptide-transferase homolog [Euphorbia lathyris]|uniref:phospho-N-acetylmuramoyl-pentapeptide- transferase homolog n=1 Tax=Euphorbia lathyris TaxID=212925 RepID=UPI003314206D